MHCCAFTGAEYIIMNYHLDIITPIGFNQWLESCHHDIYLQWVVSLTPGYWLFTSILLLFTPSSAMIPRATTKS